MNLLFDTILKFLVPILNNITAEALKKGVRICTSPAQHNCNFSTSELSNNKKLLASVKKLLDKDLNFNETLLHEQFAFEPLIEVPGVSFCVSKDKNKCCLSTDNLQLVGQIVPQKRLSYDFPVYAVLENTILSRSSDGQLGAVVYVLSPNFIYCEFLKIKNHKRLSIHYFDGGKTLWVYKKDNFVFVKDIHNRLAVYDTENMDTVLEFEKFSYNPEKSETNSSALIISLPAFEKYFNPQNIKLYKNVSKYILESSTSKLQRNLLNIKDNTAPAVDTLKLFVNINFELLDLVRKTFSKFKRNIHGDFPQTCSDDNLHTTYIYNDGNSTLKTACKELKHIVAEITWTGYINPYTEEQKPFRVRMENSALEYTGQFIGSGLELLQTGKFQDGSIYEMRVHATSTRKELYMSISKDKIDFRCLTVTGENNTNPEITIETRFTNELGCFKIVQPLPSPVPSVENIPAKISLEKKYNLPVISNNDSIYTNIEKEALNEFSKILLDNNAKSYVLTNNNQVLFLTLPVLPTIHCTENRVLCVPKQQKAEAKFKYVDINTLF